MEKYNNAILQKRVESERQVMGLTPFSRRDDVNQSFIGPNNSPLSFEETQRMNRKYEAQSDLNRLSSDISSTEVSGDQQNQAVDKYCRYSVAHGGKNDFFTGRGNTHDCVEFKAWLGLI